MRALKVLAMLLGAFTATFGVFVAFGLAFERTEDLGYALSEARDTLMLALLFAVAGAVFDIADNVRRRGGGSSGETPPAPRPGPAAQGARRPFPGAR